MSTMSNINNKIVVANIDESTKTKVKYDSMITIDEVISIDNKEETRTGIEDDSSINIKLRTDNIINRTNVEGYSNINIKTRTENVINKKDTSTIVEIEKI